MDSMIWSRTHLKYIVSLSRSGCRGQASDIRSERKRARIVNGLITWTYAWTVATVKGTATSQECYGTPWHRWRYQRPSLPWWAQEMNSIRCLHLGRMHALGTYLFFVFPLLFWSFDVIASLWLPPSSSSQPVLFSRLFPICNNNTWSLSVFYSRAELSISLDITSNNCNTVSCMSEFQFRYLYGKIT